MNDLREYLPEEDKDLISDYIDTYKWVGDSSLHCDEINHLLRFWADNKQGLFQMMGNQLVIEKPVNYEKSQSELEEEMEVAVSNACYEDEGIRALIDKFHEVCYYSNWYSRMKEVNEEPNLMNARVYLQWMLDEKSLALNRNSAFNKPTSITFTRGPHAQGNKPLVIKSDMKLMRALAKLVDWFELDKEAFERLRILHSRVLNDKSIKSVAGLTIHPMDYITMSDNACDWDSCMNWSVGGDYRLGTIEMMNSPVVIEAYVASRHPFYPISYSDERTWTNKRWRCLYIVNKDIITEVKPYPYKNDALTDFFMCWIKELAEKNMGWKYADEMFSVKSGTTNELTDNWKCKITMRTYAMYNDYYDNHWAYIAPEIEQIILNYSGETECVCCGEALDQEDFIELSKVVCNYCEGFVRCAGCGLWISADDANYYDSKNYCDWCFDVYFSTCNRCGEFLPYDRFKRISEIRGIVIPQPFGLSFPQVIYDFDNGICDDCVKTMGLDKLPVHDGDIYIEDVPTNILDELNITEEDIQKAQEALEHRIKLHKNNNNSEWSF